METVPAKVVCYSGYRESTEPREFWLGEDHFRITAVKSRSREETTTDRGIYNEKFVVETGEGREFRLTHQLSDDSWEVSELR